MTENRKIAAILVADVVGYSRLARADEEGILARLRALRADLIDPTIAARRGRLVKRTGDGFIIEFRSVVDAVRCAIEIQTGMVERNAGVADDRRIELRIGVHLGDVVEEADGDLMGDGVNIAARLEGAAQPGAICLSEQAYWQVKGRLDLKVSDLGQTQLKNIAEPIHVYSLEVGKPAQAKPAAAPAPEKSGPPRLSIVVLPFANIGGDPEQEHFVDGVTESLTTDLSRIRGAVVIARNTAFTYKGEPLDVKSIGRELNVRYALEGSVQRAGKRMRVNVQLIDAETGNHLWAERFDKPLTDLFDMQDEIVARLANALDAQLAAAEARRAEQAPNPDSMDLYFQGLAWFNKGVTADNLAPARGFFDRALIADPGNVDALIDLARADVYAAALFFAPDPEASFAAAEAKLTRALSSVPDHARGHIWLGFVDIFTRRAAQGIAECEHALALDRNLASAHAIIGLGKVFVGRAEETEAHVLEAFRLSPRDMMAYTWMTYAAIAKNILGSYDSAVVWCRRAVESNRNHPTVWFQLAIALAWLTRADEARSAAETGLALAPAFTVSRARRVWTGFSDDGTYLTQVEGVLEGLRKAGVPEILTRTQGGSHACDTGTSSFSHAFGEAPERLTFSASKTLKPAASREEGIQPDDCASSEVYPGEVNPAASGQLLRRRRWGTGMSLEEMFTKASNAVARAAGAPLTFIVCCLIVIVWAVSGPFFGFSDTWQLVINTGTTIVTFLMVFLIQNTQNRDGAAIQAKLDELIRASGSQNEFIGIEHLTQAEVEEFRLKCAKRAAAATAGDKAVIRSDRKAKDAADQAASDSSDGPTAALTKQKSRGRRMTRAKTPR